MSCIHHCVAIGETFTRCLVCLSWRFTIGGRWWPQHYELPWSPNGEAGGESYQISGIRLTSADLT
jgi:hypothetical protein